MKEEDIKPGEIVRIRQMVYLFKEFVPLKNNPDKYDVYSYFAVGKKKFNENPNFYKDYQKTVPIYKSEIDRITKRANEEERKKLIELIKINYPDFDFKTLNFKIKKGKK